MSVVSEVVSSAVPGVRGSHSSTYGADMIGNRAAGRLWVGTVMTGGGGFIKDLLIG